MDKKKTIYIAPEIDVMYCEDLLAPDIHESKVWGDTEGAKQNNTFIWDDEEDEDLLKEE